LKSALAAWPGGLPHIRADDEPERPPDAEQPPHDLLGRNVRVALASKGDRA
jgi:hypothetical protein